MDSEMFNFDLARRFVNDMSLPIQVIDEETFNYWIELYEDEYGSKTLWELLEAEISEKYGGNDNKFLDAYYDVRDRVIKAVTDSEAYKRFNEMKMPVSDVSVEPMCRDLYNESNVNGWFVSFDLVKSNIQALNYADPEILLNSPTYGDFISKFTDSEYIAKSKHFRQVAFGQMNPKRHISLATILIKKVYAKIREVGLDYRLCCISSDEIVFEVPSGIDLRSVAEFVLSMDKTVEETLGLEVRVSLFRLEGYRLNADGKHKVATFYTKTHYGGKKETKCVPLPYASIVHKLMEGKKPEGDDLVFQYDSRCKCRFENGFSIEKIY